MVGDVEAVAGAEGGALALTLAVGLGASDDATAVAVGGAEDGGAADDVGAAVDGRTDAVDDDPGDVAAGADVHAVDRISRTSADVSWRLEPESRPCIVRSLCRYAVCATATVFLLSDESRCFFKLCRSSTKSRGV